MQRPLLDTHPELLILERSSNCLEFRVENKRLGPRAYTSWLSPALAAICWQWVIRGSPFLSSVLILVLVLIIYTQCTQVLWESVIVFPATGIQFETHKGILGRPLFVSRKFISLSTLSDVIINEGLRGWDVRYYLAALTKDGDSVKLQVAYENLLPRFPVLHEVYLGVHELLLSRRNSILQSEGNKHG